MSQKMKLFIFNRKKKGEDKARRGVICNYIKKKTKTEGK